MELREQQARRKLPGDGHEGGPVLPLTLIHI
jgi:hypothetical protein